MLGCSKFLAGSSLRELKIVILAQSSALTGRRLRVRNRALRLRAVPKPSEADRSRRRGMACWE